MFKPNNQPGLFGFETELSNNQRGLLEKSKEKWFYHLIFSNINEFNFRALYSDQASRPNVPVNVLISALILKEQKGISYDELIECVMFDLRYKTALGLLNIDEMPFSRATLFNFQNRILAHEEKTGINLIEQLFDSLSAAQLKQLSLKADIQRTDSTLISSNIRKYSRVRLLIEVLIRLERILKKSDLRHIGKHLQDYLQTGSDKYVYGLKSGDLPRELEKLGQVYYVVHSQIHQNLSYQDKKEFVNFMRVYQEQFVIINQQLTPRENEQLNSGMLQSPDDPDATYRQKKDQHCKGYALNATETANPDNPIQLITDIVVTANNVDDSKILNERIDIIKEKTPELNELHTDGGYGSEDNDEKLDGLEIKQITTAVRGRESEIEKKIEIVSESPVVYTVECPGQKAASTPTKQRHKVRFDLSICKQCALKEKCQIFKNKGRFYFGHNDYLLNRRNHNINNIPKERRKIRSNVEATMKQFKTKTQSGKVKVRGIFKTSIFAYSLGIAINFGRIFNYLTNTGISGPILFENTRIGMGKWLKSAFFELSAQKIYVKNQILTFFRSSFIFAQISSLMPNLKFGSF